MGKTRRARSIILSKAEELCSVNKENNIVFFDLTQKMVYAIKLDIMKLTNEAFNEKYKFNKEDIIALGDTNVQNSFIEKLIPHRMLGTYLAEKRKDKSYLRPTFKCYKSHSIDRWHFLGPLITHVIHENAISSWKCAMENIGDPKYGIILILPKESSLTLINL